MALFRNPFRRARRSVNLENPASPLTAGSLIDWSMDITGGQLTEGKALSIPAVWAAVDFLSSSLAGLPLKVYRRREGARQEQHGTYWRLLNRAPNAEQTAYDWRKFFWERVLLYGRCYSIIVRRPGGMPESIWTPDPSLMQVERVNGQMRYTLYDDQAKNGTGARVEAADIIDVPWILMADGVLHQSPLQRLGKTIQQGIGAIEYGRRFFANGGMAHFALIGPLTTQGGLQRSQETINSSLKQMGQRGGQVVSLPVGHDLKQLSANPDQSQMIEAQRFTVEQVARIYGVPPTMLQDWRRSTYANMEQGDTHVVKHTLTKWAVRLQQQLNLKLFGQRSERLYVEHSMAGVMRGDMKARAEALARQIQTGQITPNEARGMDNREPKAGGDDLLIQGATVPLKDQGKQSEAPPPAGSINNPMQKTAGDDDDESE